MKFSVKHLRGYLLLLVGTMLLWACANTDKGGDSGVRGRTEADYGLIEMETEEEALYAADATSGLAAYPAEGDLDDFIGYDEDGESIDWNTEEYNVIYENSFLAVIDNPLSTFSIDVDTASYANTRRFLNSGSMPYKDAVRIEEMINYFTYDYPEPEGEDPFSFTTELSECPWNDEHKLLHIGLQAEKIDLEQLPPNNLVFLVDTSGSMDYDDKLGLLKGALRLLTYEMRPEDRVSIVAYADATGLVLDSTSGEDKEDILDALDKMTAGGSTAGGAGIELAYQVALDNFDPDANNRVILCTDGDFNVGPSSEAELIRMIEEKRDDGIFLTVLGFGTGNLQDAKMESIADTGNGNYAYIDSLMEAKKVLVNEMGGTLVTIAKDVKLQIEFNPTIVESYRLIGYENRMLAAEDFEDDTKDAGELGAGHTVTALYELVMADGATPQDSSTRYQDTSINPNADSDELLFIKFRYKKPDEDESILIEEPVYYTEVDLDDSSDNFRFSAAVAEFGLLLRDSEHKADSSYKQVIQLAEDAMGQDTGGYRSEFVDLVEIARALDR